MNKMSWEILSLAREAGVLVEKNRIAHANSAAIEILGKDCVGKTVAELFGADVAGNQASSFVGDISIGGKHYILRVSKNENGQIFFFYRQVLKQEMLSTPFLYSLQNCLSTMSLCVEQSRAQAEKLQDEALLGNIAAMTRTYYRMLRLVYNTSTMIGIAEKNVSCEMCTMNISGLYRELMQAVADFSPNISYSLNIGEDIFVNADYSMAQQLLLNLISNALVHAKGCDKISVSLSQTENSVMLAVSDNGCGIAPNKLHSVFERYRSDFSISELGSGAGLGLSVCGGIAEIHGGTILLESREGQGTTIRVSLSKKSKSGFIMHGVENRAVEAKDILIGLADCLPAECFSEKYMD